MGVGLNRGEGRGWPCLRRPTTRPRLPRPTRCTRAVPTPIEELTSTTTTTPTLILTPTRRPPTWLRPRFPPTTSTTATFTHTEGGPRLEGPP